MIRYFALRFEQQFLCYLSGGVLALFLIIPIPSVTVLSFCTHPGTVDVCLLDRAGSVHLRYRPSEKNGGIPPGPCA